MAQVFGSGITCSTATQILDLTIILKMDYPILCSSLRELIQNKQGGLDANIYQSNMTEPIRINRDLSNEVHDESVAVIAGLGEFEIQCTTDKSDIEWEMQYLRHGIQGLLQKLTDLHLANAQIQISVNWLILWMT